MEAVLEEAKICRIGQLMVIAGDLNTDHLVIPTANSITSGHSVDLEKAFSIGQSRPALHHLYL